MLERLNVRILCVIECVRIKSGRMLTIRKFKCSNIIFDYSNIFIEESTIQLNMNYVFIKKKKEIKLNFKFE